MMYYEELSDEEIESIFEQYTFIYKKANECSNDFVNYSSSTKIERQINKIKKIEKEYEKLNNKSAYITSIIRSFSTKKRDYLGFLEENEEDFSLLCSEKRITTQNPMDTYLINSFKVIHFYYKLLQHRKKMREEKKKYSKEEIEKIKADYNELPSSKKYSEKELNPEDEVIINKYKTMDRIIGDCDLSIDSCKQGQIDKKFKDILFNVKAILEEMEKTKKPIISDSSPNRVYTLQDIRLLNGYQFELFLKILFQKMKYEVSITSKTRDQGCDLIISKEGYSFSIQAKKHSNNVGNDAIMAVSSSVSHYSVNRGMVISTSGFTDDAKILAESNDVELINGKELSKLLLFFPIKPEELESELQKKNH